MTRTDCIEQARQYLTDSICRHLEANDMTSSADDMMLLRDVLRLPKAEGWGVSQVLPLDEIVDSVGIGWIEQNCFDPDGADIISEVLPVVWVYGLIFDAETEEYYADTEDPDYCYNHWRDGFRIWSDGKKPDIAQRTAKAWSK